MKKEKRTEEFSQSIAALAQLLAQNANMQCQLSLVLESLVARLTIELLLLDWLKDCKKKNFFFGLIQKLLGSNKKNTHHAPRPCAWAATRDSWRLSRTHRSRSPRSDERSQCDDVKRRATWIDWDKLGIGNFGHLCVCTSCDTRELFVWVLCGRFRKSCDQIVKHERVGADCSCEGTERTWCILYSDTCPTTMTTALVRVFWKA